MNGTKSYLKWKNVMVIKVPQYKGLKVDDIIVFAKTHVDIQSYLTEFDHDSKLNWEWLCNIVNTLIPNE